MSAPVHDAIKPDIGPHRRTSNIITGCFESALPFTLGTNIETYGPGRWIFIAKSLLFKFNVIPETRV